jgi:hypothetical protein
MKIQTSIKPLFLLTLVLTACNPAAGVITPTATVQSTTLPTNTSLPTTTTTGIPLQYVDPVDGLIQIIEASDPASPKYDPGSAAYAEFPDTLKQLAALNSSSNNAASMLAYAMGFPRQDSNLAAQALISLGPIWAATDLPDLITYLTNQRPEIRMYSAIIFPGEYRTRPLGSGSLCPHCGSIGDTRDYRDEVSPGYLYGHPRSFIVRSGGCRYPRGENRRGCEDVVDGPGIKGQLAPGLRFLRPLTDPR